MSTNVATDSYEFAVPGAFNFPSGMWVTVDRKSPSLYPVRQAKVFHSFYEVPVMVTDEVALFEKFEKAFESIFEDIFAAVPVSELSSYFPLLTLNELMEDSLATLAGLRATNREKALVLIALHSKGSTLIFGEDDDATVAVKVLKIVRKREKLFRENHSTVEDVLSLLDPIFSQNGADLREFMRFYATDEKSFTKLATIEMRDLFHLVYTAFELPYKENFIPVKDVKVSDNLDFKNRAHIIVEYLNEAPLHHPEFKNFVLEVKAGKVSRVIVGTPECASEDDAVAVAKILSEEAPLKDKFFICEQMNRIVLPKISEEFRYSSQLSKMYGFFVAEVDQPTFVLETMLKFFTETSRDFTFSSVVETGKSIINSAAEPLWLSDTNYLVYVMKRLVDRFGVMSAVEKILEVCGTGSPLTLAQWVEYLDNHEVYANAPVGWLVEML